MLFVIFREDDPARSSQRESLRAAHMEHLERVKASILVAGPLLDAQDHEQGSLYLVDFATLEAAWDFAHEDPFHRAGLFSRVEVRPYEARYGRMLDAFANHGSPSATRA